MTFARLFAVVAVLHVVIIGTLLVQSGCQSVSQTAPTPQSTLPSSSGALDMGAEANAQVRLPPTRRSSDNQPLMNQGVIEEIIVLEPTPIELSKSIATEETITGPGTEYTVRKGDSLWALSKRFGVSINTLASANGLTAKSTLRIDQKLVIPDGSGAAGGVHTEKIHATPSAAVSVDQPGHTYKVKPGDSLSKIAKRSGTTVAALKSINGLTSDTIRVGQELLIPGKHSATSPEKARAWEPEPKPVSISATVPQPAVVTQSAAATETTQPVVVVDSFDQDDDSLFDDEVVSVIPVSNGNSSP